MEARIVKDVEALLDPDATAWRSAPPERLALEGTPLDMQPSAAIRAAWSQRRIGAIGRVAVAAAHDGRRLAFRLEWADASEDRGGDGDAFPDGAAVLLPSAPHAPVFTMGAPGMAVNAWYWRADGEHGRQVVAEGVGTTRTVDLELVRARAVWKEGRWRVVLARALRVATADPVAQLEPGAATGFAVAVWDGSAGERAGLKSYSGHWRELRLAALPRARRTR
jgi:DMSO reductase family type II enzyme heme b subunit